MNPRPSAVTADTLIGGRSCHFPHTGYTIIGHLASEDLALRTLAFEKVVGAYWKPAYKYVRLKWKLSNEDAKDLIQGFFTRALDKGFFRDYDPAKASFRTYLRMCLDRFGASERQFAQRLKRGGGIAMVSLDFEGAERELACATPAVEDCFHQEWIRSLFEMAVGTLRERCESNGKSNQFRAFECYDLRAAEERITYDQLARQFEVTPATITNYLAAMRRDLRRILLEKLREITSGDSEFRNEARVLLGIKV
jgi:DNA-directed RNA polymerase specialized sigma24 family protein